MVKDRIFKQKDKDSNHIKCGKKKISMKKKENKKKKTKLNKIKRYSFKIAHWEDDCGNL